MKRYILLAFLAVGMFFSFGIGKKAMARHMEGHDNSMVEHTVFITNDTDRPVRMYNEGSGRDDGMLINPGQVWKGVHGIVVIYVAADKGMYRLTSSMKNKNKVALNISQIKAALNEGSLDEYDFYTRSGKIKDFDIYFEGMPVSTAD